MRRYEEWGHILGHWDQKTPMKNVRESLELNRCESTPNVWVDLHMKHLCSRVKVGKVGRGKGGGEKGGQKRERGRIGRR